MRKEVIMAGFGGQGVMSIGKNLVKAGVEEGLEVTWVPSYGPEMRGGTANCSVILSDSRIGNPLIEHPTELIAMNRPSLAKFQETVQPGGCIFVNSSVIPDKVDRDDVSACYIPCDEIALELGSSKCGNMVMLGAYIGKTKVFAPEMIEGMIEKMFTGSKAHLVEMNKQALRRGMACVES